MGIKRIIVLTTIAALAGIAIDLGIRDYNNRNYTSILLKTQSLTPPYANIVEDNISVSRGQPFYLLFGVRDSDGISEVGVYRDGVEIKKFPGEGDFGQGSIGPFYETITGAHEYSMVATDEKGNQRADKASVTLEDTLDPI